MPSAHSMNARKCVHAQKPYPSQAVPHQASNSFEARSENEGDKRDIGQEADGKKAAQQNKARWRDLNKAYLVTTKVNNVGGGTPNFP